LDDLLDDVSKADGQFGDVGDNIQAAFAAGVAQVEEYTSLINDNIMYYAAAVLDPRIKCNLIKEQYGDEATDIIKRIRDYLKKEYQKPLPPPSSTNTKLPPITSVHQLGLLRRARKSNGSAICDIDRYLDTLSLDWDEADVSNYDPDWVLKWWKANAFQYPLMATAARDLLAVPGSEVDVERLFCGGRDLLGIRRFGLKGETMRILTLLKAYFERKLNEGKAPLPEASISSY
jgi:hypothetical protein